MYATAPMSPAQDNNHPITAMKIIAMFGVTRLAAGVTV
jgi:hypothetical protein